MDQWSSGHLTGQLLFTDPPDHLIVNICQLIFRCVKVEEVGGDFQSGLINGMILSGLVYLRAVIPDTAMLRHMQNMCKMGFIIANL